MARLDSRRLPLPTSSDLATDRLAIHGRSAEAVRIGGSGAQREIVQDTLLVALMRGGQAEKARALLDRRLHRRPSSRDAARRAQRTA